MSLKPSYLPFFRDRFAIVFGLFIIVFFILQQINHRFMLHDFEVYHSAAKAYLHGEQVYGVTFGIGSGYYKYAPFFLWLTVPLALVPLELAKLLYYFVLAGCSLLVIGIIERFVADTFYPHEKERATLIRTFAVLICGSQLYRELHLGNINMILLLLSMQALIDINRKQRTRASILLGLIMLIKPHFLILLPLLFLSGQLAVFAFTLLSLGVGLLLPFLADRLFSTNLTQQWIQAMSDHNVDFLYYPNTVYSLLYRLVLSPFVVSVKHYLLYSLASMLMLVFGRIVFSRIKEGRVDLNFWFLFLLALIPSITNTDTEHFLFTLPIAVYLLNGLAERRYPALAEFAFIAFLCYGANYGDLVGKTASTWMTENGFIGIGNLCILAVALYVHSFHTQNKLAA